MNFPMEFPIFQFFYWLVNTAGLGGIAITLVGGGSVLAYCLTLRWIARGGVQDSDAYAYPTPGLHGHAPERPDAHRRTLIRSGR